MLGGGLIQGAPGEWSDDTAMTVAVARAATSIDLATPEGLDAVCCQFATWVQSNPKDIGGCCASASRTSRRRLAQPNPPQPHIAWTDAAHEHFVQNPRAAGGNGALMRTAPVALALHTDRDTCSRTAAAIARLTHADPTAAESCVLWCEAIRVALLTGELQLDAGLDLLETPQARAAWEHRLSEATNAATETPVPGHQFINTGYTVDALQVAAAAILATRDHPTPFTEALHSAVRAGGDTDTTAAITGALAGALYGASALPAEWVRRLHGWPGFNAADLTDLAHTLVGEASAPEPPRSPWLSKIMRRR
jgi:ADP-ribosylglycohydrolase